MAAELIIATSNITNWPNVAKTMSEPDALLRRMHATIHISCKPEYAKPDGTMDWSIVDAYIKASNGKVRVEDCFWMDIHEYDPRNGQVIEVGHSMRSLLDKLVSTMNARRNHNDKTAARTRQFRSALSRVDYRTLYPLSGVESMELQVMDKNPLSILRRDWIRQWHLVCQVHGRRSVIDNVCFTTLAMSMPMIWIIVGTADYLLRMISHGLRSSAQRWAHIALSVRWVV
jgi:hypothetical protein